MTYTSRRALVVASFVTAVLCSAHAFAQTPYEPTPGQPGKDVVWVPTPPEVVEKMLDMAEVTPQDFVMDLGSGDGRNIIAAAKRGANAVGVEFNPEMVALAQQRAKEAGVADKARFIQGDMYEADISKATVLALFLLPSNLDKLQAKFLALKPGTRIVLNTFAVTDWEADATETVGPPCSSWCTSLLVIVPARVDGTWRLGGADLALSQSYQTFSGTYGIGNSGMKISGGRMRGDQITFKLGPVDYVGRVSGDRMEGTATMDGQPSKWTAVRTK
jgi:precorrin-6B methylase 2